MSVSGKEESGVLDRQNSSLSAGIPIKKRRLPLFRPPSPPPEEPSPNIMESTSMQNGDASLSEKAGVTVNGMSDAINDSHPVVKEDKSFQESDIGKTSFLAVNKESPTDANVGRFQNNANVSCSKSPESNIPTETGPLDSVDGQEKQKLNENFAEQKIPSNTALLLACDGVLTLDVAKDMINKRNEDCKLELSPIPGNATLSLGQNHQLVSSSSGSNGGVDSWTPRASLSLSLSEKEFTESNSILPKFDSDDRSLCASRSNWDLNTTMDSWEGSIGLGFDGLQETNSINGAKPFINKINKNGMVGFASEAGKNISAAVEQECHGPVPPAACSQPFKSVDALNLSLGTSYCHISSSKEHSCSYANVDASSVVPKSKLLRVTSTGNLNLVNPRIVKSEPFYENAKQDFMGSRGDTMFDAGNAKQELIGKYSAEASKTSTLSPQRSVEQRLIKPEPFQEANLETHTRIELAAHNGAGKIVQCQDNSSSIAVPLTPEKSCPSGVPLGLELSVSGDVANQLERSTCNEQVDIGMTTCQDASGNVNQVAAAASCSSVVCEAKELNESDGKNNSFQEENLRSDALKMCKLKASDELSPDSRGNVEGTVSDDEKINISPDMLEEDSYGSDFESEGRKYARQDDEYEDGEVRDPVADMAVEDLTRSDMCTEVAGECDNKGNTSGCCNDSNMIQSQVVEEGCKTEDGGLTSDDQIKECVDTVVADKTVQNVDKDGLQESLILEEVTTAAGYMKPTKATLGKLIYTSQEKDTQQDMEKDVSCGGPTGCSEGAKSTAGQVADENVVNDTPRIMESILPRTESSTSGNDGAKDANSGGSRSRIISLPRASNVVSPFKSRSITGRSLPSHTVRERHTVLEGEKLQARGNRDETYTIGPQKFVRERIQDHSFRSSRLSYTRGRGDFTSEMYKGPADYRFSRSKPASAVADVDLDFNDFEQDGAVIGGSRGGRKPLNDELPSFHHRSSRRLSPGSRDVSAARGIQRLRRIPPNLSLSRCAGEDGSELGGLRHREKFMRSLPEDIIEPVFSRSQPYEGFDSQFAQRNRTFTSIPRRGVPRIHSKSPIRSRTRSPGPRSSPGRSPNGFNGLPGLTRRRSPIFYRVERRSPDPPCFPEEVVTRRRGSPHFVTRSSNESRDMNSGREHGHPRSFISNRSPPDRILHRSTRKLDNLDPRERTETDEYLRGQIRSGRFYELGGDGSGDERRKFVEGRGLVRSFRPTYNSADDHNFRFHLEDGSRPTSFCQENGSDLIERSNLRERDFDRRIKNRPLIAAGRMRGTEELEGSYRHRGQVWHDDAFDDVSRVKRRRF